LFSFMNSTKASSEGVLIVSYVAGPRGSLSEARIALRHSMGGSLALKFITAQPEGRSLLPQLLSLPYTALIIKAKWAFDMQWTLL